MRRFLILLFCFLILQIPSTSFSMPPNRNLFRWEGKIITGFTNETPDATIFLPNGTTFS